MFMIFLWKLFCNKFIKGTSQKKGDIFHGRECGVDPSQYHGLPASTTLLQQLPGWLNFTLGMLSKRGAF